MNRDKACSAMGEGSAECKQVYYRSTFEKIAPYNREI